MHWPALTHSHTHTPNVDVDVLTISPADRKCQRARLETISTEQEIQTQYKPEKKEKKKEEWRQFQQRGREEQSINS